MAILVGKASEHQVIRSEQVGYIPTRTIDTEYQYGKIVRRIMLRLDSYNEEPSIENIVLLMERTAPQQSRATVRLYRSAILHYIDQQKALGLISDKSAENAVSLLKAKHASERSIERLSKKLDASRSTVAGLAKSLFLSSVMLGLRPSEWFAAHLDASKLHIKNGKSTNGRGTGEFRIIDLSNPVLMLNRQKIGVIEQTLSTIRSAISDDRTRANLLSEMRQVVRRCKIMSGGRNITFTTARHQFAANMKAAGLTKREIADLMGHASPDTAATHYGRRVSGHKSFSLKRGLNDSARPVSKNIERQT
ncbi:MAG: hypothetical protein B7Z62_08195 [Deltaproteobacteria bacterium 37-65-8]|nr:MAG: hypothetical protein B7Z62_08195 [Deltaproteobacteria bacterium 37-65-8]